MAWRTPYLVQAFFALVLAAACKLLPESPRWLVLHGRRTQALKEIERLGIHREEAEKDILRVSENDQAHSIGGIQSLLLPFRKQYRSRTILALFVLGMVQLSGIDGILYVSCLRMQSLRIGLMERSLVRTSSVSSSWSPRADSRIFSIWSKSFQRSMRYS